MEKNIKKTMENIIKNAKKNKFEGLNGYFKFNNYLCACDGYTFFMVDCNYIIFDNLVKGLSKEFLEKCFLSCGTEPLNIPSLPYLKELIKIEKTNNEIQKLNVKTIIYNFGEKLPVVNAKYLLNILQSKSVKNIFYNPKNLNAPLYFIGDNVKGLLIPIKSVYTGVVI